METKSKQKRDSKGRFMSAKTQVKNKYTPGTFGYWWTVTKRRKDIEGKFYKGSIDCSCNYLTSLKGAPKEVSGDFFCDYNKLASLKGAPKEVGGNFFCAYNNLTSLKGAPEKVSGYFCCHNNKLTSLQGAPEKVGGGFWCHNNNINNNKLKSLLGAPEKVGGNFWCHNNKLASLQGAPKEVGGSFSCDHNNLISLQGAPEKVGRGFYCAYNNLTSLKGAPEKVSGYFCCHNHALKMLPDNLKARTINGDVYQWKGSIWSFFDGVQKEVSKVHKAGALTVYTMKDGTFAVYDGEAYAHGATLKEAKEDLLYKRTSRDLTEFEGYTMDTELKLEDAVRMYRSITGACSMGTKEFCFRLKLKKAYTLKEIIEITEGAYGNEKLKAFFKKGE